MGYQSVFQMVDKQERWGNGDTGWGCWELRGNWARIDNRRVVRGRQRHTIAADMEGGLGLYWAVWAPGKQRARHHRDDLRQSGAIFDLCRMFPKTGECMLWSVGESTHRGTAGGNGGRGRGGGEQNFVNWVGVYGKRRWRRVCGTASL